MYCRRCHYPLHSLDSRTCPECGRPFDPDDPRTFSRISGPSWRWETFASLLCLVFVWLLDTFGLGGFPSAWLLYEHYPAFLLMALGVGFGLAGVRRGTSLNQMAAACGLVLNGLCVFLQLWAMLYIILHERGFL